MAYLCCVKVIEQRIALIYNKYNWGLHIFCVCSPASMDLGTMDVFCPKFTPMEVPPLRFELPSHAGRKRPWRNPDGRANELTHPYKVPLLTEEELEFLRDSALEVDVLPEQVLKRGNFYVHSNVCFSGQTLGCQQSLSEKSPHSPKSHLKIVKDTDESIKKRKEDFLRKDLDDREKYFPHVVQSPRSLHISTCLRHLPLSSNVSDAAERILKYQYYIEAGIDESFIAPIRERWIKNAVHHVGKHAIQGLSQETVSHTLQHVSEEVHHEYILSMRKAIIDYILQVYLYTQLCHAFKRSHGKCIWMIIGRIITQTCHCFLTGYCGARKAWAYRH